MIKIERGLFKDLGHLVNGEIACQEYPMLTDEVKPYVMEKEREGYLAKISGRFVGYALCTFDQRNDFVTVDSIGVMPKFRMAGIGKRIITKVCMEANADSFGAVRLLAPSYTIEDKEDPWNIEHWLWKNNFKAVGVQEGCWRYGRNYDWYIFERITSHGRRHQAASASDTPD